MDTRALRLKLNPAVVKGAAYAGAGLVVLARPEVMMPALPFLLAGTLVVVSASNLWGHARLRDSAHARTRAFLALAAAIGILVAPRETVRAVELIVAAYLAVAGLLAVRRGLGQGRKDGPRDDIGRGVILLAAAVVMLVLPDKMVSLAVVAAASAAVLMGLIMLTWGSSLGAGNPEVAGRGFALEVLRHWLTDRDLGPTRREAIADTLYFEGHNSREKIASYVTMLVLSVTIASLAILQDSTAVIIGAMLIAPLMTPIMGCAAGLVAGWRPRVVASLGVVAASVASAIGLAWVLASWVPALVPLDANSQVLSRTSPTLLDMAIALAAGAAGAYATVNERVSQSLTGVAIAVALVPPLGVVGVALEAGRLHAATGAFLLFVTNLVSVILASVLVFVLVGFSPVKQIIESRRAMSDLASMVAVAAILIMVPLGLSERNVIETAKRSGDVQYQVEGWLGSDSTLQLVRVTTTPGRAFVVLSGNGDVPSIAELEQALEPSLGRHVSVTVEFFPSEILTAADQRSAADSPVVPEGGRPPKAARTPPQSSDVEGSEGPPTVPETPAREETSR